MQSCKIERNSMKSELVSIVLPTYKGSDVLERAINSVLLQTYPQIEIIVVDDNSPESEERKATEIVMSQYETSDNIAYIKHEKNKNGAAARNTGIKSSHGEYIAFLDDDDWFLSRKIEEQVKYLDQHKEFDACYCLSQFDGKPIETVPYIGDVSKELLLLKSNMQTSCLVFRKGALTAINGFDESFRRHQDYELLLRFFQAGFKIGCVEKVLVARGIGAANNLPNADRFLDLKVFFLKSFEPTIALLDKAEPGFKKKTYALHYGTVFVQFVTEQQLGKALKLASKYFFYSPKYFMSPMCFKIKGFVNRRVNRLFKLTR